MEKAPTRGDSFAPRHAVRGSLLLSIQFLLTRHRPYGAPQPEYPCYGNPNGKAEETRCACRGKNRCRRFHSSQYDRRAEEGAPANRSQCHDAHQVCYLHVSAGVKEAEGGSLNTITTAQYTIVPLTQSRLIFHARLLPALPWWWARAA